MEKKNLNEEEVFEQEIEGSEMDAVSGGSKLRSLSDAKAHPNAISIPGNSRTVQVP